MLQCQGCRQSQDTTTNNVSTASGSSSWTIIPENQATVEKINCLTKQMEQMSNTIMLLAQINKVSSYVTLCLCICEIKVNLRC